MWPNPKEPAKEPTEEILNGKLHFLCSVHSMKTLAFLMFPERLTRLNSLKLRPEIGNDP